MVSRGMVTYTSVPLRCPLFKSFKRTLLLARRMAPHSLFAVKSRFADAVARRAAAFMVLSGVGDRVGELDGAVVGAREGDLVGDVVGGYTVYVPKSV